MKNAMQLKAIIKNISKKKKISAQLILQNYMLERLLERVSLSKYHDNVTRRILHMPRALTLRMLVVP